MPALLVEGGFITNSHDRAIVNSRSGRAALVTRHRARDRPLLRRASRSRPTGCGLDRPDAVDLAAALARRSDPATASTVFIAQDGAFYDVVAVAPLARRLRAPVLLRRVLRGAERDARRTREGSSPQRVVLLGGAACSGDSRRSTRVAAAAHLTPDDVDRLGGHRSCGHGRRDRAGARDSPRADLRRQRPSTLRRVGDRALLRRQGHPDAVLRPARDARRRRPRSSPSSVRGSRRCSSSGGPGAVPAAGVAGLPERPAGSPASTPLRPASGSSKRPGARRAYLTVADSTRLMDAALRRSVRGPLRPPDHVHGRGIGLASMARMAGEQRRQAGRRPRGRHGGTSSEPLRPRDPQGDLLTPRPLQAEGSHVESEAHDVAVLHDVVLALDPKLTCRLGTGLPAQPS